MTPGETRRKALSTLRATRRKMISSAWSRKLRRQDLPTRRRAADALLNIGSAIDTIELAELESIANAMRDNERDIERGIEKLRSAIDTMRSVTGVLNSLEQLLALGGRIAPLLI